MARSLMFILASLFTVTLYGTTSEEIHNWKYLSTAQQAKASALVTAIYTNDADVLDEFRIATSMTYYSIDLAKKYRGEYPASKSATVIVGYVPLQFVEYYERELQDLYDKKDDLNVVPRLDVILAIHYTESNFIPSAVAGTEDNPSFGMMQLTLSTAKDLYRRDKETYQKFFSIDGNKVVFGSTRKQVSLTIKFLTEIKKYTREYETRAVTRYNGSGDDAEAYAALVLNRARLYKKMRSGGQDMDREEFIAEYSKPEVKTVINNQIESKGMEPLTDGEYKQAIDKALTVYEYEPGKPEDNITIPAPGNGEIKRIAPVRVSFPPIPDDGCEYYIKVQEGRTLYSYFLNIKDMVYAVCDEKNQEHSLFYKTSSGKKVLKSIYDIDPKNNNMQTDVKAGDIIYLPPDIVIKGDNATLSSMSRICPETSSGTE